VVGCVGCVVGCGVGGVGVRVCGCGVWVWCGGVVWGVWWGVGVGVVGVWCRGVVWGVGGVWVCGGWWVFVCVWGEVSPCARTFQGLHSVRLWTPTIFLE
jgi:hypothetical protein